MSLSEDKLKKLIAGLGTAICLLAFAAGYVSGMLGWWITFPLVFVVYFIIMSRLVHH